MVILFLSGIGDECEFHRYFKKKHFSSLKNYEKPGIYSLSPRAFSICGVWEFRD